MRTYFHYLFMVCFLFFSPAWSQENIPSPEEFLGYPPGAAFTPHYQVVNYLERIAEESGRAVFQRYGETYEGRPLTVLFISSANNIENLEAIRINNLRKAHLLDESPEADGKVIVWLSYGVHGNESSSTEAAMATAYQLLQDDSERTRSWLENTVVVIDPCLNPDGRDRYVHGFKQNRSARLITDPMSADHDEAWPGGRMNHYLFDLNRDWAWLSQKESQDRNQLYNAWMPQIHVDFHEQGYNTPYYFAPAAQPYHALITDWQKDFQEEIGKNHARYFDENNWLYFTRERFDLFYPGYGDTYPTYNGAIGMTYEQAGGGIAGLGIETETGDTLTLADRIDHHLTTGLSTIEVASDHAEELEQHFMEFFDQAFRKLENGYNTFVVKYDKDNARFQNLVVLLEQHGIKYGQINSPRMIKAYDFHGDRNTSASIGPSDLVIPAQQAKSVLVRVLFEPGTTLEDSLTYDITSWSIPYAYGLESYASNQVIEPDAYGFSANEYKDKKRKGTAYAYAFRRNDVSDFSLATTLMHEGLNIRTNYSALSVDQEQFPAGSFFVLKGDNRYFKGDIDELAMSLAERYGTEIYPLQTGYSEAGPDLGSTQLKMLDRNIKVGVLYGENVMPYDVGEIWHLFEQELPFPLIRLNTSYLNRVDLDELDVFIIPSGYYGGLLNDDIKAALRTWVAEGGRLILMGRALRYFRDDESFSLKTFLDDAEEQEIMAMTEKEDYLRRYEENERLMIRDKIHGGIYRTRLDNTHPVAFGYPEYYFTLKTQEDRYALLDDGWNVATISGPEDKVSGFAGSNSQPKTYKALVTGVEEKGAGEIVYFVDNPLFRSFWENGKLMFLNAVFMP